MSRLAELIEQLCPDGVEYRALGDVGAFVRGGGLQKADFVEAGMPCVHYGQIHTRFGISTTNAVSYVSEAQFARLKHAEYGDLLIATTSEDDEAVGKATAWLGDGEVAISGDMFYYRHNLEPKYVSYFFASSSFQEQKRPYLTGAKVRRIADKGLSRIQIPVPPVEIQREIVRILDQFTTLEAELEAELEARQAQYEHYRNHLLSMTALKQRCGEIAMRKLGEVGVFHGGLTGKTKADFVDSPDASAFVTYKEIYSRIEIDSIPVGRVQVADKEKQLALQYGDVLFTGSSENSEEVGMTAVVTSEFSKRVYLNSFSICFRWSEELFDPGYAKHMFNSPEIRREIQRCASGVTRFNLSKKRMEKISVPVPPLEVQHEIMRVLDDFDALVNDISSGLPAEIEARRAQYEHYRDRLLSFPEKKAE